MAEYSGSCCQNTVRNALKNCWFNKNTTDVNNEEVACTSIYHLWLGYCVSQKNDLASKICQIAVFLD